MVSRLFLLQIDMRPMIIIKIALLSIVLFSNNIQTYAQLKKAAKIERVKSFTNGSVVLNKTIVNNIEVYSVTLKNNSQYHQPIVFYLGNKEEMIQNLKDLSMSLESGKKGDIFDFSACGNDYQLSFSHTLGQKCFKIWEPMNTSVDFGRFFKATIDDILVYFSNEEGKINDETGGSK